MSALPRAIYKLDVIAVKISKGLLIEWDKLILKLIWKGKKIQIRLHKKKTQNIQYSVTGKHT